MIKLLRAKENIYWENPHDGESPFCTKDTWYEVIKYTDYTVIFENDLGMPHNWNIDEVDEYFWTIDFEKGFEVNHKGSELVFKDEKFHNITAGIYDLTADDISKRIYKDFILEEVFTVTKYSNQHRVKPSKQERLYENWKMSISRSKYVRCISDNRILDYKNVEGIVGFLNKDENMFYYTSTPNKYIAAKVYHFKYPDDTEGWEFVKENCDSLQKSIVPEVNAVLTKCDDEKSDILEVVESTKNKILASFGVPKKMLGNNTSECTPTYNPVKNISRNKFLRCVDMCKEKVVFNNLDGSNTYWMDKSPCGKYYYWDKHNCKNEIIYFRGEFDWVEKNYHKDNPEQKKKLADLAEKLKGYYDEKDPVIVSSASCEAIKSDGGKSDYYKITLPNWVINKQQENGYIMLEDLAEIIFDNDFNFTNVFKAQKRMFELKKGRGKAGNDFEYDAKKCHYYIDKQIEVEGRE